MGFNSAEIAIAAVLARIPNEQDRADIEAVLVAADKGLGRDDRATSQVELHDYLDRLAPLARLGVKPAINQAEQILSAVSPPADISPRAKMRLQVRAELARVTYELGRLQRKDGEDTQTDAQARAIAKLEADLGRAVKNAQMLATEPAFASMAGEANAAIIRIASYRSYSVLADAQFATPRAIAVSKEGAIASARLELAAVRDALEHIDGTCFRVAMKGILRIDQVEDVAGQLSRIRDSIQNLRTDAAPNEVAALVADFDATVRQARTVKYDCLVPYVWRHTYTLDDVGLPMPFGA